MMDIPLIELSAYKYGENKDVDPIRLVDPIIMPNGRDYGFVIDLSSFGLYGMAHIRFINNSNEND